MKFETKKLGELIINYDRLRKPLSSIERSNMKGIYPYYGATCIFDYVNDYIFDGEYILLGEDGTVITKEGHPVLQKVKGKFWPNNHTHILKNNDNIDFNFLYYLLSSININTIVTGAVQPKISQSNLNSFEITYPIDICDQKKIAKILSNIDDKIELNNKINDNLAA